MSDTVEAIKIPEPPAKPGKPGKPGKPVPTPAMESWVVAFGADPANLPGAVNTPPPRLTDQACMALIKSCGSSWKEVKKQHLTDKVTMNRLIEYRKSVVDGAIKAIDAEYGETLIAKAVGSTNLTSDYDITFASKAGDGTEIAAVRKFNAAIKGMFGVPPGICFDTNAYAKDFLTVSDKTILGTAEAPRTDGKPIDPIESMRAIDRSDQDVGALTKQREYMSVDQWAAYRDSVLAGLNGIADAGLRAKAIKETETQFSEAESTYALKAVEKIRAVVDLVRSASTDQIPDEVIKEANKRIAAWKQYGDTEQGHAVTDALLSYVSEHFEAQAMEANNTLYLDKMEAARRVQAEQKALEALLARGNPPPKADGGPDLDGKETEIVIEALKARAKKEITDANYFAAEAYLSEGPLQHIVNGTQVSNPEALAKLRPDHLLGSINEQFGDFMKDCGHYKSNMGEAFCQTSKYFERMLHGIVLLRSKEGFEDMTLAAVPIGEVETMRSAIETKLLPIRGAKGEWADKTDAERFRAAAVLAPSVYGVTNMKALQALAQSLSVEINTKVRAIIAAVGSMRPGDDENKDFFAGRARA